MPLRRAAENHTSGLPIIDLQGQHLGQVHDTYGPTDALWSSRTSGAVYTTSTSPPLVMCSIITTLAARCSDGGMWGSLPHAWGSPPQVFPVAVDNTVQNTTSAA